MNHLAHFALAGEEEALVIGALLGDYVKGPLAGRLPAGIEAGVRLHRRIDGFTDSHPVPAALRSLFGPGERRLSGVLLDLYFDHLLVLHWQRFHDTELTAFSSTVYGILERNLGVLPRKSHAFVRRMIDVDLLSRYGDVTVMEAALERIELRLERRATMSAAIATAHRYREELESGFLEFFPELVDFSASERLLRLSAAR